MKKDKKVKLQLDKFTVVELKRLDIFTGGGENGETYPPPTEDGSTRVCR